MKTPKQSEQNTGAKSSRKPAAKTKPLEQPKPAEITEVVQDTADTKTFTVRFADAKEQKRFSFAPGQFMMITIFGYGEIAISITSSPYETGNVKFTVVDAGNVTHAMHALKKGDLVGLRGPFGSGFPLQRFRKKNIVFVSGGCGLAPLRSAILAVYAKPLEFGKKFILSGCKTPAKFLFRTEQRQWEKGGFAVTSTVDNPDASWKWSVGPVTGLLGKADLPLQNTVVLVCGPPVMIKFALIELRKKGFKDTQVYASLERIMHCGTGQCAHCNIGYKYACTDGPVFSAAELAEMPVEED